jgi:DNA-binding transcriptional LysR family regulator
VTIEVEIASSDEILRRLVAGEVHLGIVGAERADEHIQLEPFLDDELVGIAKPGLLPLVDGKAQAIPTREGAGLRRPGRAREGSLGALNFSTYRARFRTWGG